MFAKANEVLRLSPPPPHIPSIRYAARVSAGISSSYIILKNRCIPPPNMASTDRSRFRNAFIYDSKKRSEVLGGLWAAKGITNANLYSIVETFCLMTDTYYLYDKDEEVVQRNQQQLKPGKYFIVTNGNLGFFIASIISIYLPWIGFIIITNEVPLLRAGRSLETGTRDGSFCDAVRRRDRRCIISDDPVMFANAGRWMGYDACHIFPLAYKGKWKELGLDKLFDPLIEEPDGYYINSIRNGILLRCDVHRYFDAYEVTIDVDV